MYKPSLDTLNFFIWRKRYFTESNKTPIFHYQLSDHYLSCQAGETRAVKAFRGSSKTSNTAYHCLYRIDKGLDRYILLLSDTQTQAESIIADIISMAEELPHLTVTRAIAGEVEFLINGMKSHIVGRGISGSLRGIKRSRLRAGLIIGDDLINDELAANKVRRDRLIRYWYKVVIPSLEPSGMVWIVGTPLNDGDLFMHLTKLHPTIEIPISKGIWSDRFTDEWIDRKKQEYDRAGMLPAWKQEFELILVDDETRIFNTNRIQTCDEDKVPKVFARLHL